MKYIKIILPLILVSNIVLSQELNIPEPEWAGNILFVNDSLNIGEKLEMKKAYQETKAGASMYIVGVGKVKTKSVIKGNTSQTVIKETDSIQFIIKNTTNDIDPNSIINIFKLNSTENKRYVETSSLGTYSGAEQMNIKFLQFQAKKYGKTSYLITIPKIKNGEYAITLANSRNNFNLFTIRTPVKMSHFEKVKSTVNKGDTIWFKSNENWVEATAISHEYYGLKLAYLKKGKTKKRVISYDLISLEKK